MSTESFKMQVWRKTLAARKGDEAALRWLQKTNDRVVSQTNRKLDAFERHGLRNKATIKIVAFTETQYDSSRFKYSYENISITDMWKSINMASHFNRLKTSTLTGHREATAKRIEGMKRAGMWGYHENNQGRLVPNEPPSVRKAKNFLEFLGDLDVQSYLDYGESDQVVRSMFDAYKRGYSLKKIQTIWDAYNSDDGHGFDARAFVNRLAGRRGSTYDELVQTKRRYLMDWNF